MDGGDGTGVSGDALSAAYGPAGIPSGSSQSGWIRATDGNRLYWRAWGPEANNAAPAVVICHGVCEHGERYPHAVAALVDAGYIVYSYDARGHGRSDGRRATFDSFCQLQGDLETFLGTVVRYRHNAPIFLLGFSLGGAVAIDHLLRQHEGLAGAIVIGSALGRGEDFALRLTSLAAALSAILPRLRLIRLNAPVMTSDPAVARSYEVDPLVHHGRLDARFVGEMLAAMRRLRSEAHRLQSPLLVLHGQADVTADPQGSRDLHDAAGSTDKTLIVYPDRRHDVLNEPGHEQVMADIIAWLAARAGTASTEGRCGPSDTRAHGKAGQG